MKHTFNLIERLQLRSAMIAIGRSTLRSQGAPGMVDHARKFLLRINLQTFSVATMKQFAKVLEAKTRLLADGFPGAGRGNWGAARKSLNIFLRDVLYCRPLCEHFQLARIEPWLEVPLDSNVYAGLVCDYAGLLSDSDSPNPVPRWPGVKALTPKASDELQRIATAIAESFGVARVHLDVRYWRKDVLDELAC